MEFDKQPISYIISLSSKAFVKVDAMFELGFKSRVFVRRYYYINKTFYMGD